MLFSADIRSKIAEWAKAQGIDENQIVAFESGQGPNLRKPGFTYKPITIPVDVPGMKFYLKVPTSPGTGLPNFSKLDPAPPTKSVDPKPKPKPSRLKSAAEVLMPKARKSSATQPSVGAIKPQPTGETRPPVTFDQVHKPRPAPDKPRPEPKAKPSPTIPKTLTKRGIKK